MSSKAIFLSLFSMSFVLLTACQASPEDMTVSDTDSLGEEVFMIESEQQDCVGVAPMKCLVVNGKFFYDKIEGFDFEPGFEYEIKVNKKLAFGTDDPSKIPADASMYTYEFVELINKTSVFAESPIPDGCESWFDGCNNCTVSEGKMAACTRKFCPPELTEEPKCLKFKE